MTQLTLFSDLTSSLTATPSSVLPVVVPVVVPVIVPVAAGSSESRKNQRDTLLHLAELIRDGRAAAEAQSLARSRPIQSIGELAQAVLLRHDLVARRRAAGTRAAGTRAGQESRPAVETVSTTRMPLVGSAQTPAQVHVAS